MRYGQERRAMDCILLKEGNADVEKQEESEASLVENKGKRGNN